METDRPLGDPKDQIADVFADLCDWIDAAGFFPRCYREEWLEDPQDPGELADLKRAVLASDGWTTPATLADRLRMAGAERDPAARARSVFNALVAIDSGLEKYLPKYYSPRGFDWTIASQYAAYGYYNTPQAEGFVLPKWSFGLRGESLGGRFLNFVRARVPTNEVVMLGAGSGGTGLTTGNPTVSVVPFLYDITTDVSFEGVTDNSGAPHFRLQHHAVLYDRIEQAVLDLRSSGAHIGIFPELALGDGMLDKLRSALWATTSRGGALEWVVAGTYSAAGKSKKGFDVYNAAYVLNERGRVLTSRPSGHGTGQQWIQHKRQPYLFTAGEQDRYDLAMPPRANRHEAITFGDYCAVFNASNGRFAVVICEDWSRDQGSYDVIRKMNCSVVIVIIMDGPVSAWKWYANRGGFFNDETGGHVVVANSLVLPLGLKGKTLGGYTTEAPVGLIMNAPTRTGGPPGASQFEEPIEPRLINSAIRPRAGELASPAMPLVP